MRKTLDQKIAANKAGLERLINEQNLLLAEFDEREQKAKNDRIFKRGEMWEELLPDTIKLTNAQFKEFISLTLTTDDAKSLLADYLAQNKQTSKPKTADAPAPVGAANTANPPQTTQDGGTPANKPTEAAAYTEPTPNTKPQHTHSNGGTGGNTNGGNASRVN